MARKKPVDNQLTLFDRGLNAPIVRPVKRNTLTPRVKTNAEVVHHVDKVEILGPAPKQEEPSPFQRESYKLYLRLISEVRSLSVKTGYATLLLVALVVFGAKIDKTMLHFFEFRALNHTLIVGVVGWSTVLLAGYTLMRAAFAFKKKHDSGAFYQGVLRFSTNPFFGMLGAISTSVYLGAIMAAILLTLILANVQMVELVSFIFINLRRILFIGPWHTETMPGG